MKEWSDMVALAFFHDETGSTVLNTLKTRKLLRRDTRKRGVTIVETRGDRSMNECSSRFGRKKGANRRDASESKESRPTDTTDMAFHCEGRIKSYTKILNRREIWNRRAINRHRTGLNLTKTMFRA